MACRHADRSKRTYFENGAYQCSMCMTLVTAEKSRLGKLARSRGNDIERLACKLLGISRVGHYGGKEDGGKSHEWLAISVKSGGSYPERIDALLRGLPVVAGQLRAVVHADTPGPGVHRRMLITLDAYDFASWFGVQAVSVAPAAPSGDVVHV